MLPTTQPQTLRKRNYKITHTHTQKPLATQTDQARHLMAAKPNESIFTEAQSQPLEKMVKHSNAVKTCSLDCGYARYNMLPASLTNFLIYS